jgi:hypothetical protein
MSNRPLRPAGRAGAATGPVVRRVRQTAPVLTHPPEQGWQPALTSPTHFQEYVSSTWILSSVFTVWCVPGVGARQAIQRGTRPMVCCSFVVHQRLDPNGALGKTDER